MFSDYLYTVLSCSFTKNLILLDVVSTDAGFDEILRNLYWAAWNYFQTIYINSLNLDEKINIHFLIFVDVIVSQMVLLNLLHLHQSSILSKPNSLLLFWYLIYWHRITIMESSFCSQK